MPSKIREKKANNFIKILFSKISSIFKKGGVMKNMVGNIRALFLVIFSIVLLTEVFFLNGVVNHLEKVVHTCGDSHSYSSFTDRSARDRYHIKVSRLNGEKKEIIDIFIHHLGSITMHRVGRDGIDSIVPQEGNLSRLNPNAGEVVVFAFGEIDVRCHIGKQRDQNKRNLDEIIQTLVDRYIESIVKFKKAHSDVDCIVFMVVPPTDGAFNKDYPLYGSLKDRIHITKKMNAVLEKRCGEAGIGFLDVYDFYADLQGAMRDDLRENVHIEPNFNQPVKNRLMDMIFG